MALLVLAACGSELTAEPILAPDAGCRQWVTGGYQQCDPLPDGGPSIVCRWVTTLTCVDSDGGTP